MELLQIMYDFVSVSVCSEESVQLPPGQDTALLRNVVHAVPEWSGEHQQMLYQPLCSAHTDVLFPSPDAITLPWF